MDQEQFDREFQQYAQSWIERNGKRAMRADRFDVFDNNNRKGVVGKAAEVKPKLDTMPKQNYNWFSQEQMYMMDNHPFEEGCPVQLKNITVDDVFQSPMMRQAYYLLDTLTKKDIVLTYDESLPYSIVEILYEMGTHYTSRLYIKIFAESEIKEVRLLHTVLKEIGLVREDSGKMSLTEKGKTALTDPNALVSTIVTYLFKDFDTSSLDTHEDSEFSNSGRLYSLWLLHHFGNNWHQLKFYEKEYLNAYSSKTGSGNRNRVTRGFISNGGIYSNRVFNCLFLNLGLTESIFKFGDPGIKKSPLLEKMFTFEEPTENMFK